MQPSDLPLSEMGEFSLIDRIVQQLGDAAAHDILVPPGDDAAAWTTAEGVTVATIDALIEGTHWRADTMEMDDVGWRAVAVNVSDLAAMGATPQYLLVALTVPPSTTLDRIDALTRGMAQSCRAHGVRIAGGDIVRGDTIQVTIAAYGTAAASPAGAAVMRRGAARIGDVVAISGRTGASAAGLALLNAGRGGEDGIDALLTAHRRPIARVDLGRRAVAAGVRCAMDVSDGLIGDLEHIAWASQVGIEVALDDVPVHPQASRALGRERALDLALGGGEDFELILVGPREILAGLSTPELPVTIIGSVVPDHPGAAIVWADFGEMYDPPTLGWDQLLDSGERPA